MPALVAGIHVFLSSKQQARGRATPCTAFLLIDTLGQPPVYDIHAPRCPSVEEMSALLALATRTLSPQQIWVNPDCGLKTRNWDEVRPALENMIKAAASARRTGWHARRDAN